MASVTFSVNKKVVYQLCDNKEVLHEIGVFLEKCGTVAAAAEILKFAQTILLSLKNQEGSVLEKEKRTTSGAFTETQTNILLKWRKLSEGNYFINHVS